MALTANIDPVRTCSGGHFRVEATLTMPNGELLTRFLHWTRAEMLEDLSEAEIEAWVRVNVKLMVRQVPVKTAANIASAVRNKTIDLSVP